MRHWRGSPPPPPSWWPADEPWAPAGGRGRHWKRRGRFLRRVALGLAAILVLSSVGAASLVSLALGRGGILGGSFTTGVALVSLATLAVVVLAFVAAMRRIGLPLGDVVAAADRVAGGDYEARVAERGPWSLRAVARAFNGMTTRLQEQDRQRRDLMADIAHELRTPLAVVQGRLEGLIDGVYARDDERLGELLEETRMLARLVEDLGTLAHSERGTLGLKKEPTDLAVLLADAARALSTEAEARGIRLCPAEGPELPIVDVDPLRIREVVTNLVSNAIRHSRAGTDVTITAERLADRVAVRIQDTGPGIAREDLPHVFDRFHKGARSQGSGLGLAIARNLVVAHGGQITVESEVGRGTTVRFTIPLPDEG